MKYLVCQIDPIVGDIAGNIAIISNYIAIGEANHCEVTIFPELAICGYPPDDLLDYNYFIDKSKLDTDLSDYFNKNNEAKPEPATNTN